MVPNGARDFNDILEECNRKNEAGCHKRDHDLDYFLILLVDFECSF
jgi:hypothetical protein